MAGLITLWSLHACTPYRFVSRSAKSEVLQNKALQTAHVGISVYEPATGKYWYNHQGDKYFVPASNTKIPTCYAAMKYLGDSLVSFLVRRTADSVWLQPAGDPSFLHPDYAYQPVLDLIRSTSGPVMIGFNTRNDFDEYGSGWSWNDYEASYMAERSAMPLYGNLVTFAIRDSQLIVTPPILKRPYFNEPMIQLLGRGNKFTVIRDKDANLFRFWESRTPFTRQQLPYKTNRGVVNFEFLRDTLSALKDRISWTLAPPATDFRKIKSQPTDSLLKPLMHRSDNFFAEQSLLMVSNQLLGYMNDGKIIDTMLKTDFRDLPQKPRWADGSGLSRYNLFTPQDFIMILKKMMDEFGMERIKTIFPTGGTGTLGSYYQSEKGFIYAKTGTLSGVVALSGFLYTKKGKLLIFSTLVNNHQASATDVRRAVEKFIRVLRENY